MAQMQPWDSTQLRKVSYITNMRNLDFVSSSRLVPIIFLIVLIAASLLYHKGHRIEWGVDFSGGILIEARATQKVNLTEVRQSLAHIPGAAIYHLGGPNTLVLRMPEGKIGIKEVKESLKDMDLIYDKIESVGPSFGKELMRRNLLAVMVAMMGVMAYLVTRFGMIFSLSGILALLHDVWSLGMLIFFVSIKMTVVSVAAILVIVGYSINDSVVIFDRVRSNIKVTGALNKNLINQSIHETMSRTLLTSCTTFAAVFPILLVTSGEIFDFSLLVLFGIVTGTFSSVFVAAPLLYWMSCLSNKQH